MNTRKSLESLTLELSEINEKQAHIINKLIVKKFENRCIKES